MYIKTNIILTENSRKRSNLISLTIKLIWFLFGEMHLKRWYCTFYLVHVAFIHFKAEKTPEFFLKTISWCLWFNVRVISVKIS